MQYSIKEKGFTLIEILIAIALLGILSAITIPNIIGYLNRGEETAYKVDIKTIQLASDAYYTDPVNKINGKKTWPLKGTTAEKISGGTPIGNATAWTSGTGYFIDFDVLVNDRYINDIPESTSSDNKIAATGSYAWYINSAGKVESKYATDRSIIGFVSGVYP